MRANGGLRERDSADQELEVDILNEKKKNFMRPSLCFFGDQHHHHRGELYT